MEFNGKVALVTGAAQGIGLAVVRALARGGARVAALDIQAGRVESAARSLRDDGLEVQAFAVDVADAAAIATVLDDIARTFGAVDILVNAAGILRVGAIFDAGDTDWERSWAVNTLGVVRLCRAVGRDMVARRSGVIVSVGSNAATTPRIGMAAYGSAKAATMQFMRCLALELAPHGVRCNLVSPGSTDTPMQRQLWTSPASEAVVIAGTNESFRLGIPLQRIATPEDIADAVCFLLSDKARHITMHDLRVDGGASFDA